MERVEVEKEKRSLFAFGHKPDKLFGYDIQLDIYCEIKKMLKEALVSKKCTDAYTGMALGIETLFAIGVLELRDVGYDIKLHCWLPYREQDKLWNTSDRMRYQTILERADEVYYVSDKAYEPELLKIKNHAIMDVCDEGLCVINSDTSLNRTDIQECISYAEKNEIPVKIIDVGTGINKQRTVEKESKLKSKSGITREILSDWVGLDNFVVMDFETTGFSFGAGARIIDIGAFEVNGNSIVRKYEQLVNPQQPIPRDITNLTGITDSMVRIKPTINQVLDTLLEFIGDKPLVFHNSDFDYNKFLKPTYDTLRLNELDLKVLCTLKMDRLLRPDRKKHNLGIVYEELTGKKAMNGAHRASVDALMTAEVAVIHREYIRSNKEMLLGSAKE